MNDFLMEAASYPGLLARWAGHPWGQAGEKVYYGTDDRQYFLRFAPEGEAKGPVVLYLHGGGWNSGSPVLFSFIGQCFARAGYHCVMPAYRLSPRHHFPAIFRDVCRGTMAALDRLDSLGIDTGAVAVVGSSAGAHLGALLCYDEALSGRWCVPAGRFRGFAGLGGPYRFDLEPPLALRPMTRDLLGPADPIAAQPRFSLKAGQTTPMLIIQGISDGVVGFAPGADFYRRALELGIAAQFYVPPAGRDTHSVYTAGCFLEERESCGTLDALFRWLEEL